MNPVLEKPRVVLFDWDETLVESWATIYEATNTVRRAMGQGEWSVAESHSNIKKSLRDTYPEMYGDRWEEARQIYYDAYKNLHLRNLKPKQAAADLLHTLWYNDVWLGVISNKAGDYLRPEVDYLGWQHYFKVVVGSSDAAHDKPHPAVMQHALRGTDYLSQTGAIWYVGDKSIDIELAKNTNCIGVLLHPETITDPQPHLHFPDCDGLLDYVNNHNAFQRKGPTV